MSCDEDFLLKDYELIKIYDYYLKIVNELEKIVNGGNLFECCDDEEMAKRQRRCKEFCTRFLRNYLYPLRTSTRDVEKMTKLKNSNELLRVLTKAYQMAANAVLAINSYLAVADNLPVLDRIKECIRDLQQLRNVSKSILEPIEKSLGSDLDQMELQCLRILQIPEYKKPITKKKKKKIIVKPVGSLNMYEPKLTNWMKKAKQMAKIKNESPVEDNEPIQVKSKLNIQPVLLDRDVDTAIANLQPEIENQPKCLWQPPKNTGLICVVSETQEEPITPPEPSIQRNLHINQDILNEILKFKAEIDETDSTESAAILSKLSDDILNEIINEISEKMINDDFVEQLTQEEINKY